MADSLDLKTATVEAVCEHIEGELLLPSHARFPHAVKQWNSVFDDKKPLAIVYCNNVNDVSLLVKWIAADSAARPFSVRSSARGGHLWSGYSVLDGGIVLDLSRMNTISVEKSRYARVGPGLEQGWANRAMAPYQRMFPTSGDCNQFAFGGFVQGGGFSLFARGKGIAADYMVEATVVLMDGSVVTAKEDNEYSDLWWGLRGGGAGNFGIVTEMVLDTFPTPPQVLSIEAWWKLPDDPKDTARLLQTWAKYHKGDDNPEFGAWLFVFPGDPYEIKIGGIWAGDDISKGREMWDAFLAEVSDLPLLPKTSVLELSAHDAVDVHQLAAAGRDYYGVIDSRKAANIWADEVLSTVAVEMHKHVADDKADYIYILFPHGGAVNSMDPKNEKTSYGKRDSPGDLLLLVSPKEGKDLEYSTKVLRGYQQTVLDPLFSKQYYPGHANSVEAPPDVKVAYYDYENKPWLYEKLQKIKAKYDPNNLLQNPVTITQS